MLYTSPYLEISIPYHTHTQSTYSTSPWCYIHLSATSIQVYCTPSGIVFCRLYSILWQWSFHGAKHFTASGKVNFWINRKILVQFVRCAHMDVVYSWSIMPSAGISSNKLSVIVWRGKLSAKSTLLHLNSQAAMLAEKTRCALGSQTLGQSSQYLWLKPQDIFHFDL